MLDEMELREGLGRILRVPPEAVPANLVSILINEPTLEAAYNRAVDSSEAQDTRTVISYYQTFLGRQPDPEGLTFWTNKLQSEEDDTAVLDALAESFASSQEFQDIFINQPVENVILALYNNNLGRNPLVDGDDVAGFNFWVNNANTLIQELLDEGATPAEARLEALSEVGEAFAVSTESRQITFKDATDNLLIDAALNGDEVFDPNAPLVENTANNFSLTIDVDDLVGTAGDDTFTANVQIVDGDNIDTLQTPDTIDGGLGTDVLNARLLTGDNIAPELVSVENVFLRVQDDNIFFDMVNTNGTVQVWSDRSTEDLEVDNIPAPIIIGLNNVEAGVDYEAFYDEDASGGSQTIALINSGVEDDPVFIFAHDPGMAITMTSINSIGGSSDIVLEGDLDDTEMLTLTGSAPVNIETATPGFLALTELVGGDFSGGLTTEILNDEFASATTGDGDDDLNVRASMVMDLSVATAGGDDNVQVNGTLFDGEDDEPSIDLGEGTDTFGVTMITDETTIEGLDFGGVSNAEVLDILDGVTLGADAALDLAGPGFTDVKFSGPLDLGTFTLLFENAPGTIGVDLASGIGNGTFDFGDASSATVMVGDVSTLSIDGTDGDLDDFTLLAGADADIAISGSNTDLGSVDSVTLTDVTVDGDDEPVFDANIFVELNSTKQLKMIDLTGGEDSVFDIDATDAGYRNAGAANPVMILIGDIGTDGPDDDEDAFGSVDYATTNGNMAREQFVFDGENIGDVDISGFTAGVGGNADRLDFSLFSGVTGLNDLDLAFVGGNSTVESDAFDGTITVAGVDITSDANNFIF